MQLTVVPFMKGAYERTHLLQKLVFIQ